MANTINDQNAAQEDVKLLVKRGYDEIAPTYLSWTTATETPRLPWLKRCLSETPNPSAAHVLELGCGAGIPCTQILAEQCAQVTANDISPAQIGLARINVPRDNATFIAGDMMTLDFEPSTFHVVVAFYSIIHLPRQEQREMLNRVWNWLSPGGHLLCNLSVVDDTGTTDDWLGSRMYWSGYDAETNLRLLSEAGFTLVQSEILTDDEDGKQVPFLWILATKA